MSGRTASMAVGFALACAVAAQAIAPPKPAKPIPTPQVLFLGEKRPLRFLLDPRFNGATYQKAWEEYLARVFAYADVNGDKVLTEAECQRLPQAQLLQNLLRGQISGDENSNVALADLDTNKDGKVSLDEVKAYYRKSGFAAVQLVPDPEQFSAQALTDALLKHLNADQDSKLDQGKLAKAEKTLAALDVNEDELLTPEELIPGLDFGFGRRLQRMDQGAALLSLVNPDDPPAKLAAPLLARYDKNKDGKLSPTESGLDQATFKALDINKDDQLDAKELAAWFAEPADLVIMAPLSGLRAPRSMKANTEKAPAPEKEPPLELASPGGKASALAGAVQKREDGTLLLTSEVARVEFHKERGAEDNLNNIRRFYREQFRGGLRNGKPYLEKKEAQRNQFLKGLFPLIDRDGDNKATNEELEAFFDLLAKGAAAFTTVRLGDHGPCLFQLLDANRDRRLSRRELRAAWQAVAHWDTNHDGCLAKEEIPRQLVITICQGTPGRAFFFGFDEEPAKEEPAKSAGPLWFRKMDVNGDGDVSRREWLGSDDDFRRIDSDGDGLIDAAEAAKADEWFRKQLQTRK